MAVRGKRAERSKTGRAERLAMGELEAAVMDVLWDHGERMTPREVQEVVADRGHDVAYTTVMTILVRLCSKGRLERVRDGRAFAYSPVESREEHAAARMREFLADTADRGVALSAFVRSLDRKDRERLRRVLGRQRRGS